MGRIGINDCKNCHQPRDAHLPDGACLFDSTHYEPYPPLTITPAPLRQAPWYSLSAPVKLPTPPLPPSPWYRRLWAFLNRPL